MLIQQMLTYLMQYYNDCIVLSKILKYLKLIFKCGIIFVAISMTKTSKFNPEPNSEVQLDNSLAELHTPIVKSAGVKYM